MKYLYTLTERKNVGLLYHFTSMNALYKILGLGIRFGKDDANDKPFISTTRNKSLFWKRVRITLDGNSISDHFLVRPYHFANTEHGKEHRHVYDGEEYFYNYYRQYEERIYPTRNEKYLSCKYIVKIEISLSEDFEDHDYEDNDFDAEALKAQILELTEEYPQYNILIANKF